MRRSTIYFRILLLPVAMVILVFMNLAFGLLPGASQAVASPGPGWVEQTPFPGGENLYAIDAVDSTTAWAVGSKGTILRTGDGGQTWENQGIGGTWSLGAVDAVNPLVAGACGSYGSNNVVLSTGDGGQTWLAHDSVNTLFRAIPLLGPYVTSFNIVGIAALDANTPWAAVDYAELLSNPFYPHYPYVELPFATSAIWKTSDGGNT